jgi:hypothetical protein
MRILPYLVLLDGALLACGTTTTPNDGGADGSNDGFIAFETGGGCFEASSPITYQPCGDASDAGADACATGCMEACQRIYVASTNSCTDDGLDAGVAYATCVHTLCAGGRRPTGLRRPRSASSRSPSLRAWLGGAAWMERASVHAFERLPRWLVREASRAARDEVNHARLMSRLARAHGARVPRVRMSTGQPRPLATIARENAVEGCVHETYGALAAMVQSERATDGAVRQAMGTIAPDEKRHAALALAVARWIEPRLTSGERARVRRARDAAAAKLCAALEVSADVPAAGLFGGSAARARAERLFTTLVMV